MRNKRRGRVKELGKNLLILALTVSAVYLLLRTQMYADFAGVKGDSLLGDVLDLFTPGGGLLPSTDGGDRSGTEARPGRIAVNLEGMGRYAVQYNQTETDRVFGTVFGLLGDALGSATAPTPVTEAVWRDALSRQTGIWFDFIGTLPLQGLGAWLGSGRENDALPQVLVRRLLLAESSNGVTLYYCNETDGMYYACATAESQPDTLREALSAYSSNGASFAFELGTDYALLDPYVLVGASAPTANVFRAANPATDETMGKERDSLLKALGFHPQSNSSIRTGDKLRVREGNDDLTVADSGHVSFHSSAGEGARYPVGQSEEPPTLTEIAQATASLCEKTVGLADWCGDARVYLLSLEEIEPGVWQADYGYSLNGAAVRLSGEDYAARFLVREGRISDFYLNFRSYTATGETQTLLPELLAAAAMESLDGAGGALCMAYLDSGGNGELRAEWIATQE